MSNSKFIDIANAIEKRIDNGEYLLNAKLPTHRLLADELNTTPVTVSRAYKLLSEKGRIESFVGRGSFVSPGSELSDAIQAPDEHDNFNFSLLQPCLHKNLVAIKNSYRQAAESLTSSIVGYTENSGHLAHREAGIKWAAQYGLSGARTDNVLLTNGAQHALSLLVETMTTPGDVVLVESLTYPGILAIAALAGCKVIGVESDSNGVNPDALEALINEHSPALVILIPRHQNPTAVSMPEPRKQAIANVINQSKTWLIEDDIYAFLDENTIPPIANFAPEYTFHISALSKAISPAMRCGYIKVPDSQIALIDAKIRASIWLASPINFSAASLMINSEEAFELASIQRDTARYRQSLAKSILSLDDYQSKGFHIWLSLPNYWQADRFTMEARNRGLLVTSGSYFCCHSAHSSHVRLSLMSIDNEHRLKEGLEKLQALIMSNPNTLLPF